jgi:hypothetical protein
MLGAILSNRTDLIAFLCDTGRRNRKVNASIAEQSGLDSSGRWAYVGRCVIVGTPTDPSTSQKHRTTTMKRILLSSMLVLVAISVTTCGDNPTTNTTGNQNCGTYEGFQLYKDAEGCYYMDNGRRVAAPATSCSCS